MDSKGNDPCLTSADPPRNFTISVEERVRAMTIGAPAYAVRKRRIEDMEALCVAELIALHDRLVSSGRSPSETRAAMLERASAVDVSKMNRLLEAHNRWYPVEAGLAMDPKTGSYLVSGRPWQPEPPYSAERLVDAALQRIARSDGPDEMG